MAPGIVHCTLLVPDQPVPPESNPQPVVVPRAVGATVHAGTVPTRVESLTEVVEGGRTTIPERLDPLSTPLALNLEAAAAVPEPALRHIALFDAHDRIQAFIDANPGHPNTQYLMNRYFALRSDLGAEGLALESAADTSHLDHFELSHLIRPDRSEVIIQWTAEGRRRIDVDPPIVMECETLGRTEVSTTETGATIVTDPSTLCVVVPLE